MYSIYGDTAVCATYFPSVKDLSELLGVTLTDSFQLSAPSGTAFATENQLIWGYIPSLGSTTAKIQQLLDESTDHLSPTPDNTGKPF